MKDFKEFQFGWIVFILVLPVQALITYFYLNHIGSKPMDFSSFLLITFVFASIYILFYGLTTNVNQDVLTVSFRIGLVRKRINIREIEHIIATKNNHLYGWGIRFIPGGTLYNISGSEAVELRFKDSKRVIRIGTQNITQLTEELTKRLVR